jgi:hypothetical protein
MLLLPLPMLLLLALLYQQALLQLCLIVTCC